MSLADALRGETVKATKRQKQTRILTMDIERLPGLAYVWEPRTEYIPPDRFVRWPSLLSIAAKWHCDADVMFWAAWDDKPTMLREAWELFNVADVVIGYNSVRFDVKHLKSEWLQAGMSLPAPWKDVDLFAEVRRSLGFESKSLDQVCKRLGIDGKQGHYSMSEAEKCMAGDVDAQTRMRAYNIADVIATETAYDRLLGWMPSHPIVGNAISETDLFCTQCGSKRLKANGYTRAVVLEYALYRCLNCGANQRSNFSRRISNTRNVR